MSDAERSLSMGPSIKEQLVLAAERLFARHGVDGVSLRQIGVDAGTTNNSAVQYHFGSKEGLVQAIFEYRLPQIIQRRRLLAAQVRPGDLRGAMEAQLLPMVELAESDGSHYMMFLEQLQHFGGHQDRHPFSQLPASFQASHLDFVSGIGALLPHLPEPVRSGRVTLASLICLHVCADRERAHHYGAQVQPFPLHVSELFDGLVGFLQAPVSDATFAALDSSLSPVPTRSVLP